VVIPSVSQKLSLTVLPSEGWDLVRRTGERLPWLGLRERPREVAESALRRGWNGARGAL
jgi:hypothetical protein